MSFMQAFSKQKLHYKVDDLSLFAHFVDMLILLKLITANKTFDFLDFYFIFFTMREVLEH